jgi:hypothetical protein
MARPSHAAQEKGAEWPLWPVWSNGNPKALTRAAGALATVRSSWPDGPCRPAAPPHPQGAGWHDVLDLDLDLLADPPAMAPAVLDLLDRGQLDAEHLADQRAQQAMGPPSWPAKTAPSFSACSWEAAASLKTPTRQAPSAISGGGHGHTMSQKQLSKYRPRTCHAISHPMPSAR